MLKSDLTNRSTVPQWQSEMSRVCLLMVLKFSQESKSFCTHGNEAGPMSCQEFRFVGKGLGLDQQDTWLDTDIAAFELKNSTGRDQGQDTQFKGSCLKKSEGRPCCGFLALFLCRVLNAIFGYLPECRIVSSSSWLLLKLKWLHH